MARGTLLKLTRETVVMEVYNPYSIVQLSEVLQELSIRRGDRVIYQGRGVVANLVNTGLMLIISVTLVDAWTDLDGLIDDKQGIKNEVSRFVEDWSKNSQLTAGYQLAVTKIRHFLAELSRWLEQVDVTSESAYNDEHERESVVLDIGNDVAPQLMTLFDEFESEAERLSPEVVGIHRAFAQRDLHPLMLSAPYVNRTYTKPLGYAGDYEMINMLYRDTPEGHNSYAKMIHKFFVSIPISCSVRNRSDSLVDYIVKTVSSGGHSGPARILSVGCGAAWEIQRFIKSYPELSNVEFSLMDFNDETLGYAEKHINIALQESNIQYPVRIVHESVHQLLQRASKSKQEIVDQEYDLIYCAGLFDYLSDRVCQRLLRLFYYWANPGGKVFVTNMHPDTRHKYIMEHIVEWHLIYRSDSQMEKLWPKLGQHRVLKDSTGINVCLEMTKPE